MLIPMIRIRNEMMAATAPQTVVAYGFCVTFSTKVMVWNVGRRRARAQTTPCDI